MQTQLIQTFTCTSFPITTPIINAYPIYKDKSGGFFKKLSMKKKTPREGMNVVKEVAKSSGDREWNVGRMQRETLEQQWENQRHQRMNESEQRGWRQSNGGLHEAEEDFLGARGRRTLVGGRRRVNNRLKFLTFYSIKNYTTSVLHLIEAINAYMSWLTKQPLPIRLRKKKI